MTKEEALNAVEKAIDKAFKRGKESAIHIQQSELLIYTKWLRQRSLFEGNFTEQQLVDAYNKEFKDIKDLHSKDK